MKKIKINVTKEYGFELYDLFELFNKKELIYLNRLKKYLDNNELHYFQYLILKSYNKNFFNNYELVFKKYQNVLIFDFKIDRFLELANRYKKYYKLKDKLNDKLLIKDVNYIIKIYLEVIDTIDVNIGDFNEYVLMLLISTYSSDISKINNQCTIKLRPINHINLEEVKLEVINLVIFENLNKLLGQICLDKCVNDVIIVGKSTLNTRSYSSLNNYCLSLGMNVCKIDNTEQYSFNFKPKVFILTKDLFELEYKNSFTYEKNTILLV